MSVNYRYGLYVYIWTSIQSQNWNLISRLINERIDRPLNTFFTVDLSLAIITHRSNVFIVFHCLSFKTYYSYSFDSNSCAKNMCNKSMINWFFIPMSDQLFSS